MSPLQVLFHQPWVARLGWTLLHFLWQGALVAALLLMVRGRASGASFRYAAACLALAVMAAAPVATFLLLGNGSGGATVGHVRRSCGLASGQRGILFPAPGERMGAQSRPGSAWPGWLAWRAVPYGSWAAGSSRLACGARMPGSRPWDGKPDSHP